MWLQRNFINTTLLPFGELLWGRTTLIKRVGKDWDLIKFCKDISTLDDLESGLHNPQDIELVMTIAHDHVLAPSDLGFEVRSLTLIFATALEEPLMLRIVVTSTLMPRMLFLRRWVKLSHRLKSGMSSR